jgi:hypothetical protein
MLIEKVSNKKTYVIQTYNIEWMTKIYKDKNYNIKNIIFPGTHNSGSKNVLWNVITPAIGGFPQKVGPIKKYFIAPWINCQNKSIYQQLVLGCRSFDLRLIIQKNIWYVHHSYTCDTLENVVNDIKNFMNQTQNTLETIILTLVAYNYDGISLKNMFSPLMNNIWTGRSYNLDEMAGSNERIVIIWDSPFYTLIFPYVVQRNNYINSWTENDDPLKKIEFLKEELKKNNDKKYWQNLTFTLTPQTNTVIKYSMISTINPFIKKGVEKLQSKINPYLGELLSDPNITNCNIVSTDYITIDFVNNIIQKNVSSFSVN